MATILKKGSSKKTLKTLIKKASSKRLVKKELDAHKYCGTVTFKEDALVLQKKWRDEWK
ncbi:MAG: hypothetical protein IT213_13670 [Cytophagales bacterium]|jgi:hypothetical protein|nr:hypothetical protein [Cytophagales bacterium]HMR58239.1 hypothetical protein [Cyclobacteriaceae bacterium]